MDGSIGNTPPALPGPSLPRATHVWIIDNLGDRTRLPGLLLAVRRHRRTGWECHVVYLRAGIPAHGGETDLRLEWVEAGRVESTTPPHLRADGSRHEGEGGAGHTS